MAKRWAVQEHWHRSHFELVITHLMVPVVHPENSQCFQHCSLFGDECSSFSEMGPSPFSLHNVALKGGTLSTLIQHVWGGGGKWGKKGREGELTFTGVKERSWPENSQHTWLTREVGWNVYCTALLHVVCLGLTGEIIIGMQIQPSQKDFEE